MSENNDKIHDDLDNKKNIALFLKDMVKKIIIVRADFEKCAKENGKIIIDPQDKFK